MIISMHTACTDAATCPNADVCYLLRRKKNASKLSDKTIQEVISLHKAGKATVYIATCNLDYQIMTYLEMGMNITIPQELYVKNSDKLKQFKANIHVSVYDLSDINLFGNDLMDVNKIYLVKNMNTLNVALSVFREQDIKNIHFAVAQDKLDKEAFILLARAWANCADGSITIDSCLEGYLVHKTCNYATNKWGSNYIDLSYDGTYRRCPFKKEGLPIGDKSIEDLLNVNVNNSCGYSCLVKGE